MLIRLTIDNLINERFFIYDRKHDNNIKKITSLSEKEWVKLIQIQI